MACMLLAVVVDGLEECRKYVLYTVLVYDKPGCTPGILSSASQTSTRHPVETLDLSLPELHACSASVQSFRSQDQESVTEASVSLEICGATKANLMIFGVMAEGEADEFDAVSAVEIASRSDAEPSCSALSQSPSLDLLSCTSDVLTGLNCSGAFCLKDPCATNIHISALVSDAAAVPSGLQSCGHYTVMLSFQDAVFNLQPQA
eukprot:scaffold195692_cov36-Prasinocladus_malaysianus.AAC.2